MLGAALEALESTAGGHSEGATPGPCAIVSRRWVVPCVLSFALFIRIAVSTHGYSGESTPPMYGDYEAQRHWMEITLHTPLSQWYVHTDANDLGYWGLDYPPLTAFQSWAYGTLFAKVEPAAVALGTSRGYETASSRLFMRWSVVASDLVCFLPGILAFVLAFYGANKRGELSTEMRAKTAARAVGTKGESPARIAWAVAVLALSPAPILIDHGHFQYNGISLGCVAGAAAAVVSGWDVTGSVLFSFALNHKQMSLYFAPAFFAHLLGKCLRRRRPVLEVAKLGITVVVTFGALWAPFALADGAGAEGLMAVLGRLVPFRRGIYEDYVANFWCATAPVARWKERFEIPTLARAALFTTILAATPAMAQQISRPSREGFVWCMANSAWAFFMFSFQVHEKSILLPLLPVTMLALRAPSLAMWLPPLACVSMWPLLAKDGLGIAYVGAVAVYIAVIGGGPPRRIQGNGVGAAGKAVGRNDPNDDSGVSGGEERGSRGEILLAGLRLSPAAGDAVWCFIYWTTTLGAAGVHVAAAFVQPPVRFLYIHSLTFTSLSFVGFVGAAMYCNWRQWQVPADALDAVGRTRMYTVVEPSEQEEGDGQEGNGLTKQHAE